METCFPAKCYQKFQKLSTMMNETANQIRTILIMGEEPENKKNEHAYSRIRIKKV